MGKETKHHIDQELVKFLVGCNIPFSVVNNPFFISFVHALRPGYEPPSPTHISENLFWQETARVIRNSEKELAHDRHVTLFILQH